MYQFYYSEKAAEKHGVYQKSIGDLFHITAVRPAMWEEHCLECSAPECYQSCAYYIARQDGRCRRLYDGYQLIQNESGCCGQGVHLQFHRWANMMTVLFPAMLSPEVYQQMTDKNGQVGKRLEKLVRSKLPVKLKWELIRTREYLRRRYLRKMQPSEETPDAFILHGYSFSEKAFRLVLEIFHEEQTAFKYSFSFEPGENLFILDKSQMNSACWNAGNLVKIYPENNVEAEIELLWCDFVKGEAVKKETKKSTPAKTVKCVAWDLDGTLWNGTFIEAEDPADLQLRIGVKEIIETLDQRGILQTIVSKNDFEPVWKRIQELGIADYFLYPQISWGAKSRAIEEVARKLNIGTDTFAFIDDTAFEREEVKSRLPEVRVYDTAECGTLLERKEFQVPITEESRQRRLLYKTEEKREQVRTDEGLEIIDFLKNCHLEIELFDPSSEEELLRSFELLSRTNQLNMSGNKYTRAEFDELLKTPGCKTFAFSCKDDFGSYGIVGFGQYRILGRKISFTEFAMSCRVAGKYVESALFTHLLEKEGCDEGIFRVKKTAKNGLLRRTLSGIGFQTVDESDVEIVYRFNTGLKENGLAAVREREA